MVDITHLRQWIGRQTVDTGYAAGAPLAGLAALLDHDTPPWPTGDVPPLGHWLYFLPAARQSELGEDGHPHRGGLLPPVPLPRRMWAGGEVRFAASLRIGGSISRRSTVSNVTAKMGSSGEMVFVTVGHEIFDADGALCIEERQDIVYRGEATATAAAPVPPAAPRLAQMSRRIVADPVLLFRYSALTFNAHRIHYDRDYAREREGYPGLVVHGPLQATLLVDHLLRATPRAHLTSFAFRARRPLFDGEEIGLHLDQMSGISELWTTGPDGQPAMTARASQLS